MNKLSLAGLLLFLFATKSYAIVDMNSDAVPQCASSLLVPLVEFQMIRAMFFALTLVAASMFATGAVMADDRHHHHSLV